MGAPIIAIEPAEGAPAARPRGSRAILKITGLALILAVMSWLSSPIQNRLGVLFFGEGRYYADELIYSLLRLPFTLLLVWWILQLPRRAGRAAALPELRRDFRFDPLMGLRAFACFFVLMGHYFVTTMAFGGHSGFTGGLLRAPAWVGVWIFFTLSGFLMGKAFFRARYTLDDVGVREFYRNRFLRLAPVCYSALFLLSVFVTPEAMQFKYLYCWLRVITFDYDMSSFPSWIMPLWTISTEMQFYMLVPALVIGLAALARRMGRTFVLMPLLFLLGMTAVRLWLANSKPAILGGNLYLPVLGNLDLFVAGMSINLLPRPGTRRPRAVALGLIVTSATFYAVTCLERLRIDDGRLTMNQALAIFPICSAIFAAGFIYFADSLGPVPMRRTPVGATLWLVQWMGILTYCLYVFHGPVLLYARAVTPHATLSQSLGHFPLLMMEVAAVAAFFYHFIEKPFEARKYVGRTSLDTAS